MICTNCGQELNDGIKFCTKCGAKCNKCNIDLTIKNNVLAYLSLIISSVSVVVFIISQKIIKAQRMQGNFSHSDFGTFFIFGIPTGIILAIIALYRRKSKLALIAGLIPFAYFILLMFFL